MKNDKRKQELQFAIANDDRELKIDAILQYAGDEFESSGDYIRLAKMTDEALNNDMRSIIEYYDNI